MTDEQLNNEEHLHQQTNLEDVYYNDFQLNSCFLAKIYIKKYADSILQYPTRLINIKAFLSLERFFEQHIYFCKNKFQVFMLARSQAAFYVPLIFWFLCCFLQLCFCHYVILRVTNIFIYILYWFRTIIDDCDWNAHE